MTRELSPNVQAGVKEDVVYPFFALDLMFDTGPLYLWTGPTDRTFEGKDYIASNSLLSVSGVTETSEMESNGAEFTLSGVPASVVSLALSEPLHNRAARMYFGALNAYENRLTYSEDITQTWVLNNVTITANNALNPDGDAKTADKLVEDTANISHSIEQYDATLNKTDDYGFRVRVNAAGRNKIRLIVDALSGDNAVADFDLTTGLTDGTTANGTATVYGSSITNLGGGWFLLEMTCKPGTTIGTNVGFVIGMGNGTSYSYIGDGSSGAMIWGAHAVVGTSFGTYARTLDKVITPTTLLYTDVFSGSMDEMNISDSSVTVRAENKLTRLERPRVRRLTSAYQRDKYPTDQGLDFVEDIQNKPIFFGKAGA